MGRPGKLFLKLPPCHPYKCSSNVTGNITDPRFARWGYLLALYIWCPCMVLPLYLGRLLCSISCLCESDHSRVVRCPFRILSCSCTQNSLTPALRRLENLWSDMYLTYSDRVAVRLFIFSAIAFRCLELSDFSRGCSVGSSNSVRVVMISPLVPGKRWEMPLLVTSPSLHKLCWCCRERQ